MYIDIPTIACFDLIVTVKFQKSFFFSKCYSNTTYTKKKCSQEKVNKHILQYDGG